MHIQQILAWAKAEAVAVPRLRMVPLPPTAPGLPGHRQHVRNISCETLGLRRIIIFLKTAMAMSRGC